MGYGLVADGRRAHRRLAVQHDQTFQSGLPFNVTTAAPAPTATWARTARISSATSRSTAAGTSDFNTTPIGSSGSAFGRPAPGTFGNMERNSFSGPGYRRTDASLFKHFRFGGTKDLELRIEVVNLFNNVNLGNPDTEIGVPGNDTRTPAASPRPRTATRTRSATSSSRSSSSSEALYLISCHGQARCDVGSLRSPSDGVLASAHLAFSGFSATRWNARQADRDPPFTASGFPGCGTVTGVEWTATRR